jgi:hypothetical protein
MPSRQDYQLAPSVLTSDRATLTALQDITAYAPHNPDHETAVLCENEALLRQAEIDVERARLALDAARERLIQAGWKFHNLILDAKAEVVAQFGPDSQAVYAIGLKRKSDRKRAPRRPSNPTA